MQPGLIARARTEPWIWPKRRYLLPSRFDGIDPQCILAIHGTLQGQPSSSDEQRPYCLIRDLGLAKGGKGLRHHEVVLDLRRGRSAADLTPTLPSLFGVCVPSGHSFGTRDQFRRQLPLDAATTIRRPARRNRYRRHLEHGFEIRGMKQRGPAEHHGTSDRCETAEDHAVPQRRRDRIQNWQRRRSILAAWRTRLARSWRGGRLHPASGHALDHEGIIATSTAARWRR